MLDRKDQKSTQQDQFSKARMILAQTLGSEQAHQLFKEDEDSTPVAHKVFTNAPVIFMLVLQRLGKGYSLEQVVQELLKHHKDLLPQNNKRVREGRLSENTSAYSRARGEISLDKVKNFCQLVADHIAQRAPFTFDQRRVFIFDATTISFQPTMELQKHFPPASNQHGQGVWPIALISVVAELHSGCITAADIGAMYGENNTSESKQLKSLCHRIPPGSIILGDSNYGIFANAYAASRGGCQFLFRLTKQRFKAHISAQDTVELKDRETKATKDSPATKTYYRMWFPTDKERRNNPELAGLPRGSGIEVLIHQITLANSSEPIFLITDLEVDAQSVALLYQSRYDVEFSIKDVKVTMDTESIRARKYDTVMKEIYGSLIAFNLVSQFRRQAAELAGVSPRRLSFTSAWLTFRYRLLDAKLENADDAQSAYQKALEIAGKKKLSIRSGQRSYPREAYQRAPKSSKFPRRKPRILQSKLAEKANVDGQKNQRDATPD